MRSAFAAVLLAAATLLSAQVLRQPEPVPRTAPNSKAFETFNRAHGNRGLQIAKTPQKAIRADLIVFPDLRARALRYHLAWAILMPIIYGPNLEGDSPKRPPEQKPTDIVPIQFRYVIDAISGEIIDRSNLSIPETL